MKSKIRSHKDLLQEEQRLEQLSSVQADIISLDYYQWKQKLEPVANALGAVKKFAIPAPSDSPLSLPMRVLTRMFTRSLMPRKAGTLLRWMVPILVKNFSSYKLNKWSDVLADKVQEWKSSKKKKKERKKEQAEAKVD